MLKFIYIIYISGAKLGNKAIILFLGLVLLLVSTGFVSAQATDVINRVSGIGVISDSPKESNIKGKANSQASSGLQSSTVPSCNFDQPECQSGGSCFCDLFESEFLQFDISFFWDPPAPEMPICVWADPSTLPPGANFPTVSGFGEATSTFTWQPNFCQAGNYRVVFQGGEECFVPLGELPIDINVNNLNRAPILESSASFISVNAGQTARVDFSAQDADQLECGDDSLEAFHFIYPQETIPSTLSFDSFQGVGFVDWTTSPLDVGEHILTTTVVDQYGATHSQDTTIEVRLTESIENITSRNENTLTYVGVCTENCTRIVFIQTICYWAKLAGGGRVPYKPSDGDVTWGVRDPVTVDGGKLCTIDRAMEVGFRVPYYGTENDGRTPTNSRNRHGNHTAGNVTNATMFDRPTMPASGTRMINRSLHDRGVLAANQSVSGEMYEFETCVFCAEGKDAGKFYGCINWTMERNLGDVGPGTATTDGRAPRPSAKFNESLQNFTRHFNFTLPQLLTLDLKYPFNNMENENKIFSTNPGSPFQFKITFIGRQTEPIQTIGFSDGPFNIDVFEPFQTPGIDYGNDVIPFIFSIDSIERENILSIIPQYMVSEEEPYISLMVYDGSGVQEVLLHRVSAMDLIWEMRNALNSENSIGKDALLYMLFSLDRDLDAHDAIPDSIDNCPTVYNPGQEDSNGNGVGDACDVGITTPNPPSPESPAIKKNRYISFIPNNPGKQTALRVKLTDLPGINNFVGFEGQYRWVQIPRNVSELSGVNTPTPPPSIVTAQLGCSPYYTDWGNIGTVHVYGSEIIPSTATQLTIYDVQAIEQGCDITNNNCYSDALILSTARWGDVVGPFVNGAWTAPDGRVDIATDVIAILDKFSNKPSAPSKTRTDIEPSLVDQKIQITDVSRDLDAFRGLNYPFNIIQTCGSEGQTSDVNLASLQASEIKIASEEQAISRIVENANGKEKYKAELILDEDEEELVWKVVANNKEYYVSLAGEVKEKIKPKIERKNLGINGFLSLLQIEAQKIY